MAETKPLVHRNVARPDWGKISEVLDAPVLDVAWNESYLSAIGMWVTLPVSLVQGVFAGLCSCCFVFVSIGNCIPCSKQLCSAIGSVLSGKGLCSAWVWWRYSVAALVALIANGQSRLALFMWEHAAFGSGEYWWHAEGIWCWSYDKCVEILMSNQARQRAFGCYRACTPDLFASSLLIFLPNLPEPDCEWAMIRKVLHAAFLDHDSSEYKRRLAELPGLLKDAWPSPDMSNLQDTPLLQREVSRCIFYMMFGKWLKDDEADVLIGWRTNALWFILPRLVQRFLFNIGINKVKKLRKDTVAIIERYDLQDVFERMNEGLGSWKREATVKLCDEIMYALGFAGIGGTSSAVESVAAFLQVRFPKEAAAKHIDFGAYDTPAKMLSAYRSDPERYIRETVRMDPPVTSATAALKERARVTLAGREFELPEGLLNQYALSMANRDDTLFPDPEKFDPGRPNLNMALTWNGAFGATNECDFPRICPGRHLSLDVAQAVIGHIVGVEATGGASRGVASPLSMRCCCGR